MIGFFKAEFGFSPREMTVLMGAHALGSAFPENSGFKGTWTVVDENALNNQYYRFLLKDKLWVHKDVSPAPATKRHWQWDSPELGGFMITSDVVLYKDLKVDSSGHTTCISGSKTVSGAPGFSNCPDSPTASIVRDYAKSNALWMKDFEKVFMKMLDHKSTNLKPVV